METGGEIKESLFPIDPSAVKSGREFGDILEKVSQIFRVKTYHDHSIDKYVLTKVKTTILIKR
jgi:hypothetical protein